MSLALKERRNTIVDTIIHKECDTCDSLKPPYANHCQSCGHCVIFMDHHCPWVNNCIGFYNQKLFFLFNFYALITLTYSAIVLSSNFITAIYGQKGISKDITDENALIYCSLCAVYLGFLFVFVVLCDQVTIILNRMRMIDRLNLEVKRIEEHQIPKRGYENFKISFGGSFGIRWFIPSGPTRALTVEELYN